MYVYHGSSTQRERVIRKLDHCGSEGPVYRLADLLANRGERVVVLDPENRRKTLTAPGKSQGIGRVLIYAVNDDFDLRVALDGTRGTPGAVKHETLFHNASVLAAGEMRVLRGIIVEVNDQSGSYGTVGELTGDTRFAAAVLAAMDRIAASLPVEKRERDRLIQLAREK